MCACEPGYLCPRCVGTPADPGYVDDDPRDDAERERAAFFEGRSAYDPGDAMSATVGGSTYDPAARRRSKRAGRERGCWLYVPAVELEAAGIPSDGPTPWYRLVGHRRSRNAGSVIVSLYKEP